MVTQKIFLGPLESKLLFSLEERGASVFSFKEAKQILRASNDSLKNVLYRLKKKRRLIEIKKGQYLFVPARAGLEGHWAEHSFFVVSKVMRKDYYIGFWTALNYLGMTEQIPTTVFVAITSRARDFEFGNQQIKFVSLSKDRFFGFASEKTKTREFNISTKEKTIVDCLLLPQYCGGIAEAAKGIWNARKEIDWLQLLEFVEEVKVAAVKRRLGFILQELKIKKDIQKQLRKKAFVGFAWADPSAQKEDFSYDKKWGLKVNVERKTLTAWME